MAKHMAYFLTGMCLVLMHAVVHGVPITSCSQLPHPEVCYSLMNSNPIFGDGKTRLGFRELNIQAAIQHVQQGHLAASAVDLSKFDPRTRAAWDDCLVLAEDTVGQLQRCMSSPSNADTQTWLSGVVANQQTCLNGFTDFSLALPMSPMPLLSSNISKFLGNSLAINKASIPSGLGGGNRRLLSFKGPFPEWVSAADRKLLQSSTVNANVVVAKDGSGNFTTISAALAASASHIGGTSRFVVHVKAGTYSENVQITKSMTNLMFIGDGIDLTVVTGSKNVVDGSTTFQSATFAVVGNGFIARGMTFENTAGPAKHQAVALRSGADFSVFYQCSFKGYQDTLYVYSQRQFYRECDVYGTVDFIFGDAVVVFQNCNMFLRKPIGGQQNTLTAQARTDPNENTGIIIHNSVVAAASDLSPVQGSVKSYLGRPWKQYARTVFMKCSLGSLINPAGWLEWNGNFALSTLYYAEYMNTGTGANTNGRVTWPGYHVITSATEAAQFTVGNFLAGNSWIPATGVPFTSGL